MPEHCREISLREAGALLLAPENKRIVLAVHVSPDGDCLGSALGLLHFLRRQGREAELLVDDDISRTFSFIPGIGLCRRPQAGELLRADLLCVLDASSLDRIGLTAQTVQAPVILNIDHHISNTRFADLLYLDAQAAATGEIMCDLFRAMGWQLDAEIALCFYTAISTDCGSFRFSNTSRKTMERAAELLDYGVNPALVSDSLDMKSAETVVLLGKVLATLEFACEGRIAHMSISHDLYDKDAQTDSFVNYPRYIYGVEAAVLFKAVEAAVTRVSMRSANTDVSRVAVAFGGGGHLRAAGCTVYAPLEEARRQVLAVLEELV